jgi:hypothetical protein
MILVLPVPFSAEYNIAVIISVLLLFFNYPSHSRRIYKMILAAVITAFDKLKYSAIK